MVAAQRAPVIRRLRGRARSSSSSGGQSGFTLVELMIVVAIIGVLAALAIYGVRRYLASAKSAEARQMVGGIARSAVGAFEREGTPPEHAAEGSMSAASMHNLCASAAPVPAAVPPGNKYQPSTDVGKDWYTGDHQVGWWCLRFRTDEPIQYQYHYTKGASVVAPASPSKCSADCFEAGAIGDLDGDGNLSRFALTGKITASKQITTATQLFIENETE